MSRSVTVAARPAAATTEPTGKSRSRPRVAAAPDWQCPPGNSSWPPQHAASAAARRRPQCQCHRDGESVCTGAPSERRSRRGPGAGAGAAGASVDTESLEVRRSCGVLNYRRTYP